jgi:hypothetical protein
MTVLEGWRLVEREVSCDDWCSFSSGAVQLPIPYLTALVWWCICVCLNSPYGMDRFVFACHLVQQYNTPSGNNNLLVVLAGRLAMLELCIHIGSYIQYILQLDFEIKFNVSLITLRLSLGLILYAFAYVVRCFCWHSVHLGCIIVSVHWACWSGIQPKGSCQGRQCQADPWIAVLFLRTDAIENNEKAY